MSNKKLTAKDVAELLADLSVEARAGTVASLASEFQQGTLTESERSMVEDIFRIMVKDAELRVRMALAQNLKENPGVPHDVALNLARDVESVSLPILRFSEVLTDEDLIEIVHGQGAAKQVAIASRPGLGRRLLCPCRYREPSPLPLSIPGTKMPLPNWWPTKAPRFPMNPCIRWSPTSATGNPSRTP